MPPPEKVLLGLWSLLLEDAFLVDIGISIYRIAVSFALACLVAIPLGILMGSFRRVEAFVTPWSRPGATCRRPPSSRCCSCGSAPGTDRRSPCSSSV